MEKFLLPVHIVCGFLSIVIFWIPIFVKKGGNIHVKIGKLYMFLMWIVVITAGLLSIENFMQGMYVGAAYLGFLVLITANPLWFGIAILKQKKGLNESYKKKHMLFNALIVLAGIALVTYGIALNGNTAGILMIIFGILGITTGREIITMYRNPDAKSNWIIEHIQGMLTSGIAAYTAFAVFGGQSFFGGLFSGYLSIIPWVTPGIVGTFLIRYYKKSYLSKRSVTKVKD